MHFATSKYIIILVQILFSNSLFKYLSKSNGHLKYIVIIHRKKTPHALCVSSGHLQFKVMQNAFKKHANNISPHHLCVSRVHRFEGHSKRLILELKIQHCSAHLHLRRPFEMESLQTPNTNICNILRAIMNHNLYHTIKSIPQLTNSFNKKATDTLTNSLQVTKSTSTQ